MNLMRKLLFFSDKIIIRSVFNYFSKLLNLKWKKAAYGILFSTIYFIKRGNSLLHTGHFSWTFSVR